MRDEQWTTPGEDMGLVLNRIAGHMECAQRAYSVRQRTADPGKCECFACADFRALRAMISAERTAAQAEAERVKAQLDAERGKGAELLAEARILVLWAEDFVKKTGGWRPAFLIMETERMERFRAALSRAGEGRSMGDPIDGNSVRALEAAMHAYRREAEALRQQLQAAREENAKLEREVRQAEQQVPPSVWGIRAEVWEEAAKMRFPVPEMYKNEKSADIAAGWMEAITAYRAALRQRRGDK